VNIIREFPKFENAACIGLDTELFYEYDSQREKDYRALAIIRSICAGCVDRDDCLEYALKHEKEGIWGGLLPAERRAVNRARRKAEQDDYSRTAS